MRGAKEDLETKGRRRTEGPEKYVDVLKQHESIRTHELVGGGKEDAAEKDRKRRE